ncbi:hypothetical protein [Gordonia sihwensis]|uniref:Integral membrane protein n=1 Tax=Gordonia sihwensis NBRC 108236 TaxID=1223544 RepID=L7LID8_9ACTN|nr:hypothetical protein [Gordonia sihwensis]GAC59833.1 hypothetical protein GSI01S_05_01540 [Gordonia sihwensis NBRC 108236]
MAVRTRTAKSAQVDRRIARRDDVLVLAFAAVALAGVLIHDRVDMPATPLLSVTNMFPTAVYLGLGLLGFVPRARAASSWLLLIWAWILVVASLIGLIPQSNAVSAPQNPNVHYVFHIIYAACQLPLVVALVLRLNRDASAVTTSR